MHTLTQNEMSARLVRSTGIFLCRTKQSFYFSEGIEHQLTVNIPSSHVLTGNVASQRSKQGMPGCVRTSQFLRAFSGCVHMEAKFRKRGGARLCFSFTSSFPLPVFYFFTTSSPPILSLSTIHVPPFLSENAVSLQRVAVRAHSIRSVS